MSQSLFISISISPKPTPGPALAQFERETPLGYTNPNLDMKFPYHGYSHTSSFGSSLSFLALSYTIDSDDQIYRNPELDSNIVTRTRSKRIFASKQGSSLISCFGKSSQEISFISRHVFSSLTFVTLLLPDSLRLSPLSYPNRTRIGSKNIFLGRLSESLRVAIMTFIQILFITRSSILGHHA